MFLTMSMADIALWILLIVCVLPIVVLSLIVFIKMLVKQIKNARKVDKMMKDYDYKSLFGGDDNILNITREMDRISIEVTDVDLVDLEYFKNANIGVMIVGNRVKLSDKTIADALKK